MKDAYNDTCLIERQKISKQDVNKYVNALHDRSILVKDSNVAGCKGVRVHNPRRLRLFINEDLALTKKEMEDGFDFDDAVGLSAEAEDEFWDDDAGSVVSSLSSSQNGRDNGPWKPRVEEPLRSFGHAKNGLILIHINIQCGETCNDKEIERDTNLTTNHKIRKVVVSIQDPARKGRHGRRVSFRDCQVCVREISNL